MTDYEQNADVSKTLTEQWKKGELKQGWYYVQLIRGEYRIDLYIKDKNEWVDCPDNIIDAVVCTVPSYEEWQELIDKKNWCNARAKNLLDKNQQLKGYNEYLRNIIIECEPYIENVCTALNMEKFANGSFLHKSNEVLSKIRTVVGEK